MLKLLKLRIRNRIRILGDNSLDIDKTAHVRGCTIYIKGNNNRLVIKKNANIAGTDFELVGNNCTIIVGEETHIGEGSYLSSREESTSLVIGSNCMFSRNVGIMTSDGHNITQENKRINPAKNITIGDHVWLANSAIVLKGSSIGDNSIVGMNSLVTKDIASNCIAAGNPAITVKKDINWEDRLTF